MTATLQNRLVGTIIVVALVVIFLPEILDGEKQHSQPRFEVIPERPQLKEMVLADDFPYQEVEEQAVRQVEIVDEPALDEPRQQVASTSGDLSVNTPTTSNPASAFSEPVMEPKKEVVQAGWVVQLGSFKHQKNVRQLLTKLERAGYRTFTRPVKTSSGTLTKVFIGPDIDKSKLEKAISHLKQVTGLQGRLTPFSVD